MIFGWFTPPEPGSLWVRRGDDFEPHVREVVDANRHGVRHRLLSATAIKQPSDVSGVLAFRTEFKRWSHAGP